MVANAESKINSEVKNKISSQPGGVTTQSPRTNKDFVSKGDGTQEHINQNPSIPYQSRIDESCAPKIKVDTAAGLSQKENTLSQLEMTEGAPQCLMQTSGLDKNGESSGKEGVASNDGTSSEMASIQIIPIEPLNVSGQSHKPQSHSSMLTHGNGNGIHEANSPAALPSKINAVPTVHPTSVRDSSALLDSIKKSAEVADARVGVNPNASPNPLNFTKPPAQLRNVGQVESIPPTTSKLTSPERQGIDPTTVIDDAVHRLRAPLVALYGSYLHPTDTSLADARMRLRLALEQTRLLRAAFTDRLYEKYRVLLRPVSKSISEIVDKIDADAGAVNRSLMEDIRIIKEEKEIEKKEAQLLASATLSSGESPSTSASLIATSLETAEQLAYIGAGLNLVILPEDYIDENDVVLRSFEHRGPTNPETGQRVGGISAAAATAAEVLLDRVRRARALRIERQKRRQTHGTHGETVARIDIEPSVVIPPLSKVHGMSNGTPSSQIPVVERRAPLPVVPKTLKKIGVLKASPPLFSSAATSKSGRSRVPMPLSSVNVLSLNPSVEELHFDDAKLASTKALITQGVGTTYHTKSSHHRYRHPHPDSLGGRSFATQSNFSATLGSHPGVFDKVSLPPLPLGKERRFQKAVKIADQRTVSTFRALACLDSILGQFATSEEIGANLNAKSGAAWGSHLKATISNASNPAVVEKKLQTLSQGQRKTTEIGLLCGLHHSTDGGNKLTDVACSNDTLATQFDGASGSVGPVTTRVAVESTEGDRPIDPVLAFSVVHALGLVRDTHHRSLADNMMSSIGFPWDSNSKTNDVSWPGGSVRLKALCQLISKKKRRFSELLVDVAWKADFEGPVKKMKTSVLTPQSDRKATKTCEGQGATCPLELQKSTPVVSQEGSVVSEEIGTIEQKRAGDVLSLRGGGGDDADDPVDGRTSTGKKGRVGQTGEMQEPAISGAASKKSTFQMETNIECIPRAPPYEMSSSKHDNPRELLPQHPIQASSIVNGLTSNTASFSSNSSAMMVAARQHQVVMAQRSVSQAIAASHEKFHQSTSPLHLQSSLHHASLGRIPGHPGSMSDFFAGLHAQRSPFGSLTDWSQLDAASAAAVGLLPSQSSLAMGIHQQHAAMVNLSVDRAARAMLVRDHQNAAVAAAQRQAVARASGVAGLTAQQAAILMGQQGGASLFQSSTSRFQNIGCHPGTTILSSPTAALMSQSASLGTHFQAMQRAAGSRPGSSSSAMSGRSSRPSSAKGRAKVGKEEKPYEETSCHTHVDANPGVDESSNKKRKVADRPLTSSSIGREKGEKTGDQCTIVPKTCSTINNDAETYTQSLEVAPEIIGVNPSSQTDVAHQETKASDIALHDPPSVTREDPPAETNITAQRKPLSVTQPLDHIKVVPDSQPPVAALTAGMQFFAPNAPDSLTHEMTTEVLEGRVHIATQKATNENFRALLDFVQAVGAAVPIPKALVGHPLKERLASPNFKGSSGSNFPSIPREVIAATVLIWLWVQHKESFQRAFAKSGRIDVDPECKWLIQAAVDASTRALAAQLMSKHSAGEGKGKGAENQVFQAKAELLVASTVSKALMTEMCIDEQVDTVLPVFNDLVELLDEARLCALRSKGRERTLLATLIARTATMSESFSHSYVSSMVRAGEALGHGDLFEFVQDEKTLTSTMIPYDIFSDEHGAWEDPCRLPNGFTPGLTGEDLMKRAHARAMIQKSLKKMQERNNIRGGTSNSGPYSDISSSQATTGTSTSTGPGRGLQRTPSGSMKKRSFSFTFAGDATQPGSGSAPAKNIAQYNPNHTSTPLFWDSELVENGPYGKHVKGPRPRVFAKSASAAGGRGGKGDRGSHLASVKLPSATPIGDDHRSYSSRLLRSTEEVEWVDVAEIFEAVDLEGIPSVRRSKKLGFAIASTPGPKKIIAPFCRKLESHFPEIVDDESDLQEDLRDENILQRHQDILDGMKEKLDRVMESRPLTAQQRARNRAEARRNASTDSF